MANAVDRPLDGGGKAGELANTVRGFLGILQKRKWTGIAVFFVVLGTTVLVTERQQPIYRATATVIIDRRSPAVLAGKQEVIELGVGEFWNSRDYLQTQYEVLRSRRLAKRVVDRLTLALDEKFLGLDRGEAPLSAEEKRRKMAGMDAVGMLMSKIAVEPKMDSQVVLVSVEDAEPHVAMQLANALVTEYKEENVDYKKSVVAEAMAELRSMMVQLKREKEAAEKRVLDFERRHSIGSLASRKEALRARMTRLNEEYVAARVRQINLEKSPERYEIERELLGIRKILDGRDVVSSSHPRLVGDSTVSRLKFMRVELDSRYRELTAKYGPKHPQMQAISSQRRLVAQSAEQEARRILSAAAEELSVKLDEARDELAKSIHVEEELAKELALAEEEESSLGRLELDYAPLVARRDEADERYQEVRKRYSETDLSAQVETNNIRIQDLATAPKKPVRPMKRVNYAVGVLIGLLLGVGFAFFVESLDNTLKTREDIEASTRGVFLGLVPAVSDGIGGDEPRGKRELFVHIYPKSSVTETFRTAKTNLFFSLPGRRPRLILVTSPGPKEGKTTVATNLGAVAALAGSRTLIIDTDMRRPRAHRVLDVPRRPGITEYFYENRPISDFVQKTVVEGLDVLTCGALSPNPVEIIESRRFRDMIDELLGLYDTIFFDSPPLLAVADAKIICAMVEMVVVVVRAGTTTKDALREATRLVEPVMGDNIGIVLNYFDVAKHSYRYYYYRSKRYGYYNYYSYGDSEVETPVKEPENQELESQAPQGT